MPKSLMWPMVAIAAAFTALAGLALAAQNKYVLQAPKGLKVPNGLAFAEFKGYESWLPVAVSQTETSVKVIVANPAMVKAYKSGTPGDGKQFPDGVKIAKIEWLAKKNTESPYFVMIPDTLKTISFIEKDLKRFPDTHGWAYAPFVYDPASSTIAPQGSGAKCGYECHSKVAAQDYIYTAYPLR